MKRFFLTIGSALLVGMLLARLCHAQSVTITADPPPSLIEIPIQLSGITGSPIVAVGVANSSSQGIAGAPTQCFLAPTTTKQVLYAVYNTDSWPADTYSITASVWNISLQRCNQHAFANPVAISQPVYYTIGGENAYSMASPTCNTCIADLTAIEGIACVSGATCTPSSCLTNPISGVCEITELDSNTLPDGNTLALGTLCGYLPPAICN